MSAEEALEQHDPLLDAVEERIGYRFRHRSLLLEALIHPSLVDSAKVSYERMEFLGDAVLGLLAAEHLYRTFPESDEGELTRIKSTVVSRTTLSHIGRQLGLHEVVLLGKGMLRQGPLPKSVTANATESLIGALYLDGGLEAARAFVLQHISARVQKVRNRQPNQNHKSQLQQLIQRTSQETPVYRVLSESGPDHEKKFQVCAVVCQREFPPATGSNKKLAEQRAARNALQLLEAELDGSDTPS